MVFSSSAVSLRKSTAQTKSPINVSTNLRADRGNETRGTSLAGWRWKISFILGISPDFAVRRSERGKTIVKRLSQENPRSLVAGGANNFRRSGGRNTLGKTLAFIGQRS